MSDVTVGAPAPHFELQTADGTVSGADLRGKPFVLYFYPKDDTAGCTREAQDFTAALPRFAEHGATVIGVSKDSVKSHARFAEKHGLKILLASDPEGVVIERFGAWVEKSLYGRKYMGIDRSTFLIDAEGVVRQAWRKVKVPGHVDKVLEALREL
jgi:peroxiredoxin Q/BCP